MTLRLDPSADAALDSELSWCLGLLMSDIAVDARAQVRVKTGRLKESIEWEIDGLVGRVSTDVPYWVHVEYGTAPHVIRPNAKRALYWPGANHPVASVNHPGSPAHPFLRPALLKARSLA